MTDNNELDTQQDIAQINALALPDDGTMAQVVASMQTIRDGLQFFDQLQAGEIIPEEGQIEAALTLLHDAHASMEAFHANLAPALGGVKAAFDKVKEQRDEALGEVTYLQEHMDALVEEGVHEEMVYAADEIWSEAYTEALEDFDNLSENVQLKLIENSEAQALRLRTAGKIEAAERIENIARLAAENLRLATEIAAENQNVFDKEDAERRRAEHEKWKAEMEARAAANGGVVDFGDEDEDEEEEFEDDYEDEEASA